MQTSLLIATMALSLSALSVQADEVGTTAPIFRNRVTIRIGDLDVNNDQDAKVMLERIARGAVKACGGQRTFSSYTGGLDNRFDECRQAAIRKAVEQLDAPRVTRLYSQACQWRLLPCASRSPVG